MYIFFFWYQQSLLHKKSIWPSNCLYICFQTTDLSIFCSIRQSFEARQQSPFVCVATFCRDIGFCGGREAHTVSITENTNLTFLPLQMSRLRKTETIHDNSRIWGIKFPNPVKVFHTFFPKILACASSLKNYWKNAKHWAEMAGVWFTYRQISIFKSLFSTIITLKSMI